MLHIVVASGNANTTNASPSVVPSYFEPHMSHHKRTVCPAKDVTKYLNKEETKNQCRIFQCRILSFFFFFVSEIWSSWGWRTERKQQRFLPFCFKALQWSVYRQQGVVQYTTFSFFQSNLPVSLPKLDLHVLNLQTSESWLTQTKSFDAIKWIPQSRFALSPSASMKKL